jgi:hypothetical protein
MVGSGARLGMVRRWDPDVKTKKIIPELSFKVRVNQTLGILCKILYTSILQGSYKIKL